MLTRPDWAPKYVQLGRADPARVYDYLLGGPYYTAADRAAAEALLEKIPQARQITWLNRAFTRRVVRYLVNAGVRQFIDIGSGIPNVENVHAIAQKLDPTCRIIYVDWDPVAFACTKLLLKNNPLADAIEQDARNYGRVLQEPEMRTLIDFSQPVAVLMTMFLHTITDDDLATRIVAGYCDKLAAGSYLALSHGTTDTPIASLGEALDFYQTIEPVAFRSRDAIAKLLSEFSLVEPGLVYLPEWRPDSPDETSLEPASCCVLGALGRR